MECCDMPRILDIKIALGNEQLILSSSLIHGQCLDTPQRRCVSDSAMSTHLPQEGGERKRAGPRRAAGVISVEQGLEERAQQGERGVCADDRRVGAAVAHVSDIQRVREEAGPIAGVTSLSLATVAVHAP